MSQKKKELSLKTNSGHYKRQSGQTKSLVAQKYKVLRSTISTWFLPANKDQITTAFFFGAIHFKGNNVKAGKHENLEKAFSK